MRKMFLHVSHPKSWDDQVTSCDSTFILKVAAIRVKKCPDASGPR